MHHIPFSSKVRIELDQIQDRFADEYKLGNLPTDSDSQTKWTTSAKWTIEEKELEDLRTIQSCSPYNSTVFGCKYNTEWYMSLHPKKLNDADSWTWNNTKSCRLFLNLKSMPDSYSKVIVYCEMRCDDTGDSHQFTTTYDKSQGKGWPVGCSIVSELSVLENSSLTFTCEFRILRIEYKNEKAAHDDDQQMSADDIPKKEQFKWSIDAKLTSKISTAKSGKIFIPADILSTSRLFNVSLIPNLNGKFVVCVILCGLPKGITQLKVKCSIVCAIAAANSRGSSDVTLTNNYSDTVTFNYDDTIWGAEIANFDKQINCIKTRQSLKIMVETKILEAIDTGKSKMHPDSFRETGMLKSRNTFRNPSPQLSGHDILYLKIVSF